MPIHERLALVHDFIQSLIDCGVTQFCVSPGSRSTPLTTILARSEQARVWSLLDERSAGFFALGLAKASRQPVALVCTSGTAAANYLPAVVEAMQDEVPLVVITADRPAELRGIGSNQTIDQPKLYGTHVKWFHELPAPAETELAVRHAVQATRRAVAIASAPPMGPVHLNYPFAEPLIPPTDPSPRRYTTDSALRWNQGLFVQSDPNLEAIAWLMSQSTRPLVVCGPQYDPALVPATVKLAQSWGAPVLADPLSQLRLHSASDADVVVAEYDLLLRRSEFSADFAPDFILRLGRTPTSKVLLESLSRWESAQQLVVHEGENWVDASLTATQLVQSNPVDLCTRLAPKLATSANPSWTAGWQAASRWIRERLHQISSDDAGSLDLEGRVFLELAECLPTDSTLFVGNSMPIRHADNFLPVKANRMHLLANRGASGIDGVISSACGSAAGTQLQGHDGVTTLVIGDVSFFHDLNALSLASRLQIDLLVILVHNDGGGIFQFLPQADHPDVLPAFTTPHGFDFEAVVTLFGGRWSSPTSWPGFRLAIQENLNRTGLRVIQLRLRREESVIAHRSLVSNLLEGLVRDRPWAVNVL